MSRGGKNTPNGPGHWGYFFLVAFFGPDAPIGTGLDTIGGRAFPSVRLFKSGN